MKLFLRYVVKDHHDFHQALSQQKGLRSLLLRADPDPTSRDDLETLMNAFCSLNVSIINWPLLRLLVLEPRRPVLEQGASKANEN